MVINIPGHINLHYHYKQVRSHQPTFLAFSYCHGGNICDDLISL